MKKLFVSLTGILFLVSACNKQDSKAPAEEKTDQPATILKRGCGTYEVFQAQLAENPGLRTRMEKIEEYTQKAIKDPGRYRLVNGVIEIPVVVHVVYKTALQNISDAQVQSQIDVLNEDFRNTNPDGTNLPDYSFQEAVSTGSNVRFVLSKTIRTLTKTTSWSTNDAVKNSKRGGSNPVDPSSNLNLWVCNLGQGLLGYAQFPGGSASTDGVVILYSAFGSMKKFPGGTYITPYDLGRTTTHEVGHWLNLRHIWGDDGGACSGSDAVDDTPNQGGENYGKPTYPHISCGNAPKGDMFMNYMDYTDDASMYMFTKSQNMRMMAVVSPSGPRPAFSKQ